jgi:hypothetical protein
LYLDKNMEGTRGTLRFSELAGLGIAVLMMGSNAATLAGPLCSVQPKIRLGGMLAATP